MNQVSASRSRQGLQLPPGVRHLLPPAAPALAILLLGVPVGVVGQGLQLPPGVRHLLLEGAAPCRPQTGRPSGRARSRRSSTILRTISSGSVGPTPRSRLDAEVVAPPAQGALLLGLLLVLDFPNPRGTSWLRAGKCPQTPSGGGPTMMAASGAGGSCSGPGSCGQGNQPVR